MKKVLFVLALGAFAACNNGSTDTKADSTVTSTTVDTAAKTTVDTTVKVGVDTTAAAGATTGAAADTTKK